MMLLKREFNIKICREIVGLPQNEHRRKTIIVFQWYDLLPVNCLVCPVFFLTFCSVMNNGGLNGGENCFLSFCDPLGGKGAPGGGGGGADLKKKRFIM